MTTVRLKTPRVKREPEAYSHVKRKVLARDHWQCQICGSRKNLHIHHQEFRSHSGADTEENLITLCETCHRRAHGSG
jgi:5-methylcytosine-specific restriction endonuclease McrA